MTDPPMYNIASAVTCRLLAIVRSIRSLRVIQKYDNNYNNFQLLFISKTNEFDRIGYLSMN